MFSLRQDIAIGAAQLAALVCGSNVAPVTRRQRADNGQLRVGYGQQRIRIFAQRGEIGHSLPSG